MNNKGVRTMSPAVAVADNYTRCVVGLFSRYIGPSLLEIGTGHGNFKEFLPPIERYVSIDIDQDVIQRARARYPDGNYQVADIADENQIAVFSGEKFDTVLCVNVLEHVKAEEKAISNMLHLLCSGGYLLLFVPAHPCLYTDLDRLAGHFRRYNKACMRKLIDELPGKIEEMYYFNPLGAIGWWLNGFFAQKDLASREIMWQVLFFDRFVLPVSRRLGFITKSLFGQSLVCVVREK